MTTTQRPSDRNAPVSKLEVGRHWFTALGPPLAAFAQQQISYGMTDWLCAKGNPVAAVIPALFALAVAAWAGLLSWRDLNSRRDDSTGEATPYASARFFGALGLLMSGLAVLVILAQWLPTLFLHPCQR